MSQEPPHTEETPPPPGPGKRRLHKSDEEKMLFGVAGGIAEYADIDPILVRIGFVALLFAGGSAIIIYIVLAIIMPGPDDYGAQHGTGLKGSPQQAVGIVIVIVGAMLLLVNLGFVARIPWHIIWPSALIGIGLFIILAKSRSSS